jgi:hypothetical protein
VRFTFSASARALTPVKPTPLSAKLQHSARSKWYGIKESNPRPEHNKTYSMVVTVVLTLSTSASSTVSLTVRVFEKNLGD